MTLVSTSKATRHTTSEYLPAATVLAMQAVPACRSSIVIAPAVLYRSTQPQFKSPEQCQMCELAISWERNFVGILPTGGGKSLVFLLATLQEMDYYTFVVVPHKALLNDHVRKAKAAGIGCIQWTTSMKAVDDDVQVIFLALETITSPGFKT